MITQPPPVPGQQGPFSFGPPPSGARPVLTYAVPRGLETVPAPYPGDSAWQDGNTLVVRKHVVLPDRCVKCNAPADDKILKATVHWHPAWLFLLILPGVLVYALVAMVMQQSGTLGYRLCTNHRRARSMWIALAWCLGLGGIVVIGVSAAVENKVAALVGTGMVILSPFVGLVARTFRATKIDPHFMWLRGANRDYLEGFPPLPPQG
jgi:hypothetical protein